MSANRTHSVAYIGLGSNLGDRIANLRAAINAIRHLGDLIAVSSVYESEPFGVEDDQPMYLNMTMAIRTHLRPTELLSQLFEIERANGRIRNCPNESRTLDLDILMIDDTILETPELVIPHPKMHERAFVILPLAEIAPVFVHPKLNRTVSEIASKLSDQGVHRVGKIDDETKQRSG